MANYGFIDYRVVIRDKLTERGLKQKDLAHRVDRSRAWVSQMLAGKRPLRPALVRPIGEALEMSAREIMRLRALVDCETGSDEALAARARGFVSLSEPAVVSNGSRPAGIDSVSVSAVLQLTRCEGYVPDPSWIAAAARPRMSVEEVEEALEQLRSHGLLDDSNQARGDDDLREERDPAAAVAYHQQALDLAKQAVASIPENERAFFSGSLALSEEDYERFCHLLRALIAQTLSSATHAAPNRVYHLSVAAFPISLYTDSFVDPRDVEE